MARGIATSLVVRQEAAARAAVDNFGWSVTLAGIGAFAAATAGVRAGIRVVGTTAADIARAGDTAGNIAAAAVVA